MKRYKQHLILAGILSALGIIGMLMSSHSVSAQSGSAPVTIVGPLPLPVNANPGGTPVQVAGTLNFPSNAVIAASQSGTWNVGVNNFPATQNVKDINAPGTNVFNLILQSHDKFLVPTTVNNGPTVQALVIEEVSGQCPPPSSPTAIQLFADGPFYFRVDDSSAAGTGNQAILAQHTRIYLNPGDAILIDDGGLGCSDFHLSGYFVTK